MVADFCSLVTLIHNTLQGEITISSTYVHELQGILCLYSPVRNDIHVFPELSTFKSEKE